MSEYQPFTIDVDLAEVQTWDGTRRPLLPVGAGYHFKIVNVVNAKGQLTIECDVLDGDQAGEKAWNNYNYSHEVGLKRLKNLIVACGCSLGKIDSDELMGATFYGDIVHNDGKAKPDAMGNVQPAGTFANIINERAKLETTEEVQEEEPPPVTKSQPAPAAAASTTGGNASAPAGNKRQGGTRRA